MLDRAARRFAAAFRLVGFLGVATGWMALAAEDLQVPWSRQTFVAEEGCRWQPGAAAGLPRGNAHYLAPPGPGDDWHQWLRRLQAYRTEARAHLHDAARPAAFDDAIYRREDLRWMTGNFVCGFLMVYDRTFWDPEKAEYRVGPLCDEADREFGGFDSVVLWHAYPRIGADPRNQFDFFRDMPGGLSGLRGAVREFHRRGIKVFLPYNPWDTGTAREPVPDDAALARTVADLEADGIFLDTMIVAPGGLRRAVDALRPGPPHSTTPSTAATTCGG